jgi:hypothetical protein
MDGLASPQTTPQSEPQQQTKQSLLLDGLRRVEQHSPIWMLPRLITTQNLHQTLADARQRLCDSHREMFKDSGVEVAETCGSGGISVQGDTRIINNGSRGLCWALLGLSVLAFALCAYALCRGPASATANATATAPAPSGNESPQNWRLGLRVTDEP